MISKEYKPIIEAAVAGGKIAAKYFGTILKIEGKSMPSDVKTKADVESEKAILKILQKKFPKYNINSEETGDHYKGSDYTFEIDPLDGTNNFVMSVPYFSVSIALLKNKEAIFGVIYNPITKSIYYAQKGKGAFLNRKRIHVSDEGDLKKSTVSLVENYGFHIDKFLRVLESTLKKDVKRVTVFWSVALDFCLLASGKIEALILHRVPTAHDFAAGKLISREAGAEISDFMGNEAKDDTKDDFLTTNGKIHKELLEVVKHYGV